MKYLAVAALGAVLIYMFSFSGYNWKKGNKLAAVGAAVLGLAACGLALFALFSGRYEL